MSPLADPINTDTPNHSSFRQRWLAFDAGGWVIVALAIGSWARVSGVGLGWFMIDQVRDAVIATGIADGTSFPLVGPQSAQSSITVTGPLYYYLIAIPYWLSPDPVVVNWFSVLLSIAGVYLLYTLAAEMFGVRVGVVTSLLYATYPLAVVNGLAVWNPGLLPLFCIAFILVLWRYLVTGEPWRLAPTLIMLAFVLNVHLTSGPLLLLFPVAWLIYRPAIRLWPALAGLGGALLFWAPFAINEMRTGFQGLKGALNWAGREGHAPFAPVAWNALVGPFTLPAALRLPFAAEGERGALAWFNAVQVLEASLFITGLGLCAYRLASSRDRRPYGVLLAWFAAPFVPIAFTSTGVLWYYFDLLYPLHCVAIALLADRLLVAPRPEATNRRRFLVAVGVPTVVGVIIAGQIWYLRNLFADIRHTGTVRATDDVRYDRPAGPPILQETMTLAARRTLAGALASTFGADPAALESRAHGESYWHFREDRGYLLGKVRYPRPAGQAPTTHYTVLRNDFPLRLSDPPTLTLGAHRIRAYQPLVRYASWRVSAGTAPGWQSQAFDTSEWRAVSLPARVAPDMSRYGLIPYTPWGAQPILFRGQMQAPGNRKSLWLVVSIRQKSPHIVAALFVNGSAVAPALTVARNSFETGIQETLFDVSPVVGPGDNRLAFAVEGGDREFDLDVYEIDGVIDR